MMKRALAKLEMARLWKLSMLVVLAAAGGPVAAASATSVSSGPVEVALVSIGGEQGPVFAVTLDGGAGTSKGLTTSPLVVTITGDVANQRARCCSTQSVNCTVVRALGSLLARRCAMKQAQGGRHSQ